MPYRTLPPQPKKRPPLSWWRRLVLGRKARIWHRAMVERASLQTSWPNQAEALLHSMKTLGVRSDELRKAVEVWEREAKRWRL
jgi:hypothetical protein